MAIAIGTRLQGNKAEIYVNGMRVQLGSRMICYPDVVVVGGELGERGWTASSGSVLRYLLLYSNPRCAFEADNAAKWITSGWPTIRESLISVDT